MSAKRRFWLKVGVLVTFSLMVWGYQNLAMERASVFGVGVCLAEDPGNIPITAGALTAQQSSIGIQISETGGSQFGTIGRSFQGYSRDHEPEPGHRYCEQPGNLGAH